MHAGGLCVKREGGGKEREREGERERERENSATQMTNMQRERIISKRVSLTFFQKLPVLQK